MELKYNFDTKILASSISKNREDAYKEWCFIGEITLDHSVICICNRKIKYAKFFCNKYNGNSIITGSKCCTKIQNTIKQYINVYFKEIIEFLSPSIYISQNIFEHIKTAEKEVLSFFESKFKHKRFHKPGLENILQEIILLVKSTKITYLNEIILQIESQINKLNSDEAIYIKRLAEEKNQLSYNTKSYVLITNEIEEINKQLALKAIANNYKHNICGSLNKNKCYSNKITNFFKKLN